MYVYNVYNVCLYICVFYCYVNRDCISKLYIKLKKFTSLFNLHHLSVKMCDSLP